MSPALLQPALVLDTESANFLVSNVGHELIYYHHNDNFGVTFVDWSPVALVYHWSNDQALAGNPLTELTQPSPLGTGR